MVVSAADSTSTPSRGLVVEAAAHASPAGRLSWAGSASTPACSMVRAKTSLPGSNGSAAPRWRRGRNRRIAGVSGHAQRDGRAGATYRTPCGIVRMSSRRRWELSNLTAWVGFHTGSTMWMVSVGGICEGQGPAAARLLVCKGSCQWNCFGLA